MPCNYCREHCPCSAPTCAPGPWDTGPGPFWAACSSSSSLKGACLRPPVPRPISSNTTLQSKYIDDLSTAAAFNLKKSLVKDPIVKQRPWNYHERNQQILKVEESIIQEELDRFHCWVVLNKLKLNYSKCFVMHFSRSRSFDFPPEFQIGISNLLEERKVISILGVQIQSNIQWDAQITQMVSRASNTIWVLKRMKSLGVDRKTLVQYWKSEGTSIWKWPSQFGIPVLQSPSRPGSRLFPT